MLALDLLALVLLAAFVAAGALFTVASLGVQLRGLPRALRPSAARRRLLAGVGFGAAAGAAGAVALAGPGSIAWWWLAAALAPALHWAEARAGHVPGDLPQRAGPARQLLRTLAGLAGLAAALAAGALLHGQQGAELLRDGVGLAPLAAGALLVGLLAPLAPGARRLGTLAAVALALYLLIALLAVLADLPAASAGLSAMVHGAWSAEAAAGGLLAAAAQAVLWSSLAGGPGLGAATRGDADEPAEVALLAAPAGAVVATLTALLLSAGPVAEATPAALERDLSIGLHPSEYGQTVVLAPDVPFTAGKRYEVVLRADPRGIRAGELLPGDNTVVLPAWHIARDVDAVILRDSDPARRDNPGFDLRIACTREVVTTRAGDYIKLRPRDPNLNIRQLMRARDLEGPFLELRDYHFVASVRRAIDPNTGKERVLLYEEPRPKDAPFDPVLRVLVTSGYTGPFLDPGGASEAPPVALPATPALAAAPGERVHLRLDPPARGLQLGFVNRLGELEVPPWDFLAAADTAILQHRDDPSLDRRVKVVPRLAFGRLRFSSADPEVAFEALDRLPEYTGPYLLPPRLRFAAEVRSGTRLPPAQAGHEALIALHPQPQPAGNPGVGLYTPHPVTALAAGMGAPTRDQTGPARVLATLQARIGGAGTLAATLALAALALAGLGHWLQLGRRLAGQVFGGGGGGFTLLFVATLLAAPAADPDAVLRVALACVGVAAVLGVTALSLELARLVRRP